MADSFDLGMDDLDPVRDPDMPDDALGLGLDVAPTKPVPAVDSAYRVLARKYRPQNFRELIGQDAMVQTLGNAIKRERLAHAFLMTGVRGVGKTSTARLVAKALNCIGPDGQGGATIDPCGQCEPCVAIAEGRHIDVIEMDAASHTGVDDVREIIEAVRYAAVSARYKIYIIDEVHMLSKNAFNALLKTLEEPPPHVKFLFATTEVNKVPITVLSRCQRFDLKRIPAELLAQHFADVVQKEGVTADPQSLALIAQAAEGSVRDGLSILDQAIAHADMQEEGEKAGVTAQQVLTMLGLSDRAAVRRLFALILAGDAQAALADARAQYALGVEPAATIAGLMREVHRVTLSKLGSPADAALPEEARAEIDSWADSLSFPQLHRLWQLLLKGHEEVVGASMPLEACDMAILRVMHASAMPDPGELARLLQQGGAMASAPAPSSSVSAGAPHTENAIAAPVGQAAAPAEPAAPPANFAELIALLDAHNHVNLSATLHDVVRVVRYAPPDLDYQLAGPVHQGFVAELRDALFAVTGMRWELRAVEGEAPPTLFEAGQMAEREKDREIIDSPLVKAAMAAFPEAIVKVGDRVINSETLLEKRSLSA